MKKIISLSSSLLLMLSGCIDDTTTTTAASQTAVVAQPPASVGSSGLSGQTVTFNPTLVFSADGLTINYQNNTVGNYPTGEFTNLVIGEAVEGDRLIVTITVNGEKIDLGFNFIDRGGEGYIDEVVLDLVEVDDEVQVLPAEISVLVTPGTVRNEKVAEAALPDFTGAPTEAEWNQYLVGTAMLLQGTDNGQDDLTLIQFITNSSGAYVDVEDGDTGTFTYSYSLTDPGSNTGTLTVSSEWKNEDDTETPDEEDLDYPGSNGHMLREDFSMNFIFTDFYNGIGDENGDGTITDLQTGMVYPRVEEDGGGKFNGITNPTLYLENNPATN
jgi:hypothetical protein